MGKEENEIRTRKKMKKQKLFLNRMEELRKKKINKMKRLWLRRKEEKEELENFPLYAKIHEQHRLIQEMETKMEKTSQSILAKEKENVSLQEIITTQEKLIGELKTGADELLEINTSLQKENFCLKEMINSQEKQMAELETAADQALQSSLSIEKQNSSLTQIINTQEKLIEALKAGAEETLQMNILKEKENFSLREIITTQEKIMAELNSWLNETTLAMNCNEDIIAFKEKFQKLIEEELHCPICTELYIKPVTLGCSHTFCEHCINKWKTLKKECPMCRKKTENESSLLFMDNFINKALGQLNCGSLKKRLELMKCRA